MAQLVEGTEFAGCRIEGVVGRGGMGVVYRATQLGLGRPVALKLLAGANAADPEFRARFEREAQMAAAIDHPNIVPVYAAGEEDGTLYLVLRFVAGTDLHKLLRRDGPLPPARAAAVVAQVGAALDAAHAAGLVHRDVKPANVLLENHHAYLSDFGLTRLASAAATQLTQEGRWLGTADYASPEQLEGRPTDARSDVYALGCVLYAALTGGPPYPRDTVPATLLAHLGDAPPKPSATPGVPAELDAVVARALAKDPHDRFPSAGDLGRAALAAARGEPVTEGERSVARGEAAPTNGSSPTLWATPDAADAGLTQATRHAPEPAATRVAGDAPPPRPRDRPRQPRAPEERPPAVRVRRRRTGITAVAGIVVAAVAAGLAAAALWGDGGDAIPAGPLTTDEIGAVTDRFAQAYAAEDSAALGRTLFRDVERVFPGSRQRGRTDVVAEYRTQFETIPVRRYRLEDLDVTGGDVGRASGRYVVERTDGRSFGGAIVFAVVRDERGRPRIDLVAARPDP